MPSTRNQKAREKRARQFDVISDVENRDVMLGTYSKNELAEQENNGEIDLDLESGRRQQCTSCTDDDFRSLLNINLSGNSEITAETNRLINLEISSQNLKKINRT